MSLIVLYVLGISVVVIMLVYNVCILVYTGYKSPRCHSLWILTYTTMICFVLAQIGGLMYFIGFAVSKPNVIGYGMIYFFNFTSYSLVLIVFATRIRATFQSTMFAYSNKTLYILYGLISTVPLSAVCLVGLVYYSLSNHISTDSPLRTLVYIVIIYHFIALISMSLVLLYLFIKKLREIEHFECKETDLNSHRELVALQLKLTVLVIVCISSTFIIVSIGTIMSVLIKPNYGRFIVQLFQISDSFVGYLCISFTINSNQYLYERNCFICSQFVHWMVFSCCSSSNKSILKSSMPKLRILSTVQSKSDFSINSQSSTKENKSNQSASSTENNEVEIV